MRNDHALKFNTILHAIEEDFQSFSSIYTIYALLIHLLNSPLIQVFNFKFLFLS